MERLRLTPEERMLAEAIPAGQIARVGDMDMANTIIMVVGEVHPEVQLVTPTRHLFRM
jgi:hypothetical protein